MCFVTDLGVKLIKYSFSLQCLSTGPTVQVSARVRLVRCLVNRWFQWHYRWFSLMTGSWSASMKLATTNNLECAVVFVFDQRLNSEFLPCQEKRAACGLWILHHTDFERRRIRGACVYSCVLSCTQPCRFISVILATFKKMLRLYRQTKASHTMTFHQCPFA